MISLEKLLPVRFRIKRVGEQYEIQRRWRLFPIWVCIGMDTIDLGKRAGVRGFYIKEDNLDKAKSELRRYAILFKNRHRKTNFKKYIYKTTLDKEIKDAFVDKL